MHKETPTKKLINPKHIKIIKIRFHGGILNAKKKINYFNCLEYKAVLDSKHVGSSPGLNGIDYEILKKLSIK